MRFSRQNSRNGAYARFEKHKSINEPLRRPDPGTPLRTITIEDHITGSSKRIVVHQALRKNQVFTSSFGKTGNPVGWDKIMRRLRAYCVIRWLEI